MCNFKTCECSQMTVELSTRYGMEWFRSEGASMTQEDKRTLFYKIREWESMAKYGCKSWAQSHSRSYHARNRRPLEGHMRNLLIEIKGPEWVHQTDIEHLKQKQKNEIKNQEYRRKTQEYNSKVDSYLDGLLKGE